MKKVFELEFEGKKFVVETGEIAKQADGAVLVRYNDTVVLSTAVASSEAKDTNGEYTSGCFLWQWKEVRSNAQLVFESTQLQL